MFCCFLIHMFQVKLDCNFSPTDSRRQSRPHKVLPSSCFQSKDYMAVTSQLAPPSYPSWKPSLTPAIPRGVRVVTLGDFPPRKSSTSWAAWLKITQFTSLWTSVANNRVITSQTGSVRVTVTTSTTPPWPLTLPEVWSPDTSSHICSTKKSSTLLTSSPPFSIRLSEISDYFSAGTLCFMSLPLLWLLVETSPALCAPRPG